MKTICYIVFLSLLLTSKGAAQELPVLPLPVHIESASGQTLLFADMRQMSFQGINKAAQQRLKAHWRRFMETRPAGHSGVTLEVTAGLIGKSRMLDSLMAQPIAQWGGVIGKEGYLLMCNTRQQIILAHTETGLFYAMQTLKQLIRANWKQSLMLADYPSFDHRAVYDDISRGPVSTVAYIKEQIERLAELKINALSFYIEHVVQPLSYPDFAPVDGKLTIAQIKELSAYAASYHMQLVGSFQSFGHFEKILSLPQYSAMGETSTLISPRDPAARKFLESVIGELCDAFSGSWFNVNCDETFDLGKGKSKSYVDSVGPGRYYADHIRFLYDIVKRHNKKLMMWGDIALTHEEILDILPPDITYLTWEYGNQASYDKWITPFRKRGLSFMVCPGILNSYRLFPDMVMASENIDGFLEEGKRTGAAGVVTTVWDDGGANLFSGDWYGVYKGADKSWNVAASGKASFDDRYVRAAYNTDERSYIRALDHLMLLRKLPLTYNLTDNVWNRQLLPDSGRRLILNNTDVDTALSVINNAYKEIKAARAARYTTDLATLQITIEQYKLLMEGRKQILQVAAEYKNALALYNTDRYKAVASLNKAAAAVAQLKTRYATLLKTFCAAWLRENQHYSLDLAAKPYTDRVKELQQLQQTLQSTAAGLPFQKIDVLPTPSAIRLDVVESSYSYFQNWLLTGPFERNADHTFPSFLYQGDIAVQTPPRPGDLFTYRDSSFRWKKYVSLNGGIIEFDEIYHATGNKAAYAYCTITAEQAMNVASYTTTAGASALFCNGKEIKTAKTSTQTNEEVTRILPLKAGTNHILLKIPQHPVSWSFSFRLDQGVQLTNQKHKYFINTEKGNHEAE